MAFAEKSSDGVFNGTTPVDIVASPGSAHTFVVRSVTVHNADTVAAVVTLSYYNSAALRKLTKVTLDPDATFIYEVVQALDGTAKKIQGVLGAAHTTTAPSFVATYADVS